MSKTEVALWQKLDARARKLEQALKSARVRKPSQVYQILSKAAEDEVCYVLYRSPYKPVQERVRNYFQKYLPLAEEFTKSDMASAGGEKARREMLALHLDRRPRKVAPPPPPPVQPEPMIRARGRAGG
jgi:hypothetical protein